MTADKTNGQTSKIVDIKPPSKSIPSASSRPIIVSNRALIRDPMVTEGAGANADSESERPPVSTHNHKIIPPSEIKSENSDRAIDTAPTPDELMAKFAGNDKETPVNEPGEQENDETELIAGGKDGEPVSDDTTSDLDGKSASKESDQVGSEPGAKNTSKAEKDSEPAESTDSIVEDVGSTEDKDESNDKKDQAEEEVKKQEAQKLAEQQASVEKLVESKEYFIPIETPESHQKFYWLALIIVIVLVVIGLFILKELGFLGSKFF